MRPGDTLPCVVPPCAKSPANDLLGSSPSIAPHPRCLAERYEVLDVLGSGGMGLVLLAQDMRLGRRVAIKILQTEDSEATQRFYAEACAMARFSHENIVTIYDLGVFGGRPFLVLEYLEGQTLASLFEKAPLPPRRALEIMTVVAHTLEYAHDRGIVHCDLKPENIFITDSGRVKVLDFGIAQVVHAAGRDDSRASPDLGLRDLSRFGIVEEHGPPSTIAGTTDYMAPEQWGIGGPIDPRTDLWAVGVILFALLSGRHPLATHAADSGWRIPPCNLPIASLRDAAPDAPPELARIVDRCLQRHKADRWPDARSLWHALESFSRDLGSDSPAERSARAS